MYNCYSYSFKSMFYVEILQYRSFYILSNSLCVALEKKKCIGKTVVLKINKFVIPTSQIITFIKTQACSPLPCPDPGLKRSL